MMTTWLRPSLLLAIALPTLAGCSSKITDYQDTALGADVTQSSNDTVTTMANGVEDVTADEDVTVGATDHEVTIDEQLMPMAMGGKEALTVVDKVMGQTLLFSYDPIANSVTLSDGTTTNVVTQNPDKSYTVDGTAAANGKAAVALLKTSPVYSNASSWSFVATYARCQTCLENAATRGQVCNYTTRNAGPPAVCDVFRDFCDCAECDKLGKMPCSKCP